MGESAEALSVAQKLGICVRISMGNKLPILQANRMKRHILVIASEAKQSQFLGLRLPRRPDKSGLLAMTFIVFFIFVTYSMKQFKVMRILTEVVKP
jgi:hypothetical protein